MTTSTGTSLKNGWSINGFQTCHLMQLLFSTMYYTTASRQTACCVHIKTRQNNRVMQQATQLQ